MSQLNTIPSPPTFPRAQGLTCNPPASGRWCGHWSSLHFCGIFPTVAAHQENFCKTPDGLVLPLPPSLELALLQVASCCGEWFLIMGSQGEKCSEEYRRSQRLWELPLCPGYRQDFAFLPLWNFRGRWRCFQRTFSSLTCPMIVTSVFCCLCIFFLDWIKFSTKISAFISGNLVRHCKSYVIMCIRTKKAIFALELWSFDLATLTSYIQLNGVIFNIPLKVVK